MKSIQSKIFLTDHVVDYFIHLPDFSQNSHTKKILIGFSGGPDSVSLMSVLYSLREKYNFQLYLAYFNHMLRPENELAAEIDFIKNLAGDYGLPLFIGVDSGEIGSLSASMGVECAARKARYAFFYRTFKEIHGDYIALAHNLDDTVENMVMRFFKGSGLGGLRGIPDTRDRIIRPFSSCPKSVILQYLNDMGMTYSVDKTNYGTDYLRNRVRNILLPQIKEIFPYCMKTVPDLADKISLAYDYIGKQADSVILWNKLPDGNGFFTSYSSFINAPKILKIQSLYNCFDKFAAGSGFEIPYKFIKAAADKENVENNGILLKGYGLKVIRHNQELIWKEDIVNKEKNSYLFKITDNINEVFEIIGHGGFSVEKSLLSLCRNDEIWIPVSAVNGTLVVRSRKDGDYIVTKKCRKKIKKIFSEWKITIEQRDMVPLICDDRGVLAIWGRFFGCSDRVSDLIRVNNDSSSEKEVYIFKIRQDNCD